MKNPVKLLIYWLDGIIFFAINQSETLDKNNEKDV